MADLVERLERLLDNENSAGRIDIGSDLVRGVLAALEAEERRGLERAAEIAAELEATSTWVDARVGAGVINRRIRALIPEAPVREGWHPIETAPKDGTVAWFFEPHDMGGFMFAGAVNADGVWINNLDLKVQNPTHWRPLPAPPQDNREG